MIMVSKLHKSRKPVSGSRPGLRKGFVKAAAVMLAATGLVMLSVAMEDLSLLRTPDPVFGFKIGRVMLVVGMLHLLLSGYLFAVQDLRGVILAMWAGLTYTVYVLGASAITKSNPCTIVELIAWKVGLGPWVADKCWKILIAYLVVGGLFVIILEWHQLKQLQTKLFMERWSAVRLGNLQIEETWPNATYAIVEAMAIAERSPIDVGKKGPSDDPIVREYKFCCPSCAQHIRCDQEYLGRRINCPKCQKQIWIRTRN